MTQYLDVNDLISINKSALEGTEESVGINNINDLYFIKRLVVNNFVDNIFKQATLLCCSIIALHPFKEGNHRTSLSSAIIFLMINGYKYNGTKEEELELYEWRYQYEEKHDLERYWSGMLGSVFEYKLTEQRLLEFMENEYCTEIENYLRNHFSE